MRFSLCSEELGVDEAGRNAAEERGRPEDPVVVPYAGDKCRAKCARRVDAHAAHGPLNPHQQRRYQSHCYGAQPAPTPVHRARHTKENKDLL